MRVDHAPIDHPRGGVKSGSVEQPAKLVECSCMRGIVGEDVEIGAARIFRIPQGVQELSSLEGKPNRICTSGKQRFDLD
jgi:hypothetical protein